MNNSVHPWIRVAILILATATLAVLSHQFTGEILPSERRSALLFQNGLLLIVLGSAFLERHYTKPADSVVNSLMAFVTLLSVYGEAPKWPWIAAATYCSAVFLLGAVCVALSSGPNLHGWRAAAVRFTYRPAVVFGRARVIFSIVFLSGLWFFYEVQSPVTLALVLFWGVFLALWPLKMPELLTAWFSNKQQESRYLGRIVRIDDPGILRIALDPEVRWSPESPTIAILPNGNRYWVQPLFSHYQEGRLLATGLLTELQAKAAQGPRNCVVDPGEDAEIPGAQAINESLGGGKKSKLVGYVVERSTIGAIRFETLDATSCYEGMLVWANARGERIYYQIVSGETQEETFKPDKHGFQIATATQLGHLTDGAGFVKCDWLPRMNAPVFASSEEDGIRARAVKDGDFILGVIPHTKISVGGDFIKDFNHHTAILGVTGAGKTELAFDLIRHAVVRGLKVVCIDLTAQYENRLKDLSPIDLSIEESTAKELSEKLFDVETGNYRAGDEKKALNEFAAPLREDVFNAIAEFLEGKADLGLIRLEEISNTKATLWITELYLTCLLKYAREHQHDGPRVLIVVEEAHTVMPEPSSMGLGDYDSRGLVGKIVQIALQGRKYGVGLLVLAQRTATVSKSILTQCNTIISFTCFDDTSLSFLRNIYGQEHVNLIPNLPSLHAVAFGKWIRSERPVVFQVPFDETKAVG